MTPVLQMWQLKLTKSCSLQVCVGSAAEPPWHEARHSFWVTLAVSCCEVRSRARRGCPSSQDACSQGRAEFGLPPALGSPQSRGVPEVRRLPGLWARFHEQPRRSSALGAMLGAGSRGRCLTGH